MGRSRHLRDRGDLGVPAAHRVPGPVRRAPGGQTGAVTQQPVFTTTGCPKKMSFLGKIAITTLKLIQNVKVGVFWKIQDICYQMGTEIFKIEEEMTEKMKPKVANPPLKSAEFTAHIMYSFDDPLHFHDL